MLYLLWTLLNIVLFIYFLVFCLKMTTLIKEKFGRFASLIFVFGLLSFVSNSGDKDDENHQVKKWTFKLPNEVESSNYSYIIIEKYSIASIDLGVLYGTEKSSRNIVAIEANSSLTGLMGGHKWEPEIISVTNSSVKNSLSYTVLGSLKWKLLGVTIYTQSKRLSGSISIK
jgi:hypothetical protein